MILLSWSFCRLHPGLPADILELWKQGAVIHHIRRSKRHREVEDEDLEAVRERERGREEQEEGELREVRESIKEGEGGDSKSPLPKTVTISLYTKRPTHDLIIL